MRLREIEFSEAYVAADGRCNLRLNGRIFPASSEVTNNLAEIAALLIERLDDPEFNFIHDDVTYRATRIDEESAIWWSLRRGSDEVRSINSVGLRPDFVKKLGDIARNRGNGLLLIGGKTFSGKTATAGAVLKHWQESYGDIAFLLESPPEVGLRGAVANGWCFKIPVTEDGFEDAFVRTLRSNAKYILIGEIRHANVARLALRAAIAGHLVVSTIHAGSIQQALGQFMEIAKYDDLDRASSLMADGLLGVVHQSLTHGLTPRIESQSLLVDGDSIRAKIRNRTFGQLKDDIHSQAARAA